MIRNSQTTLFQSPWLIITLAISMPWATGEAYITLFIWRLLHVHQEVHIPLIIGRSICPMYVFWRRLSPLWLVAPFSRHFLNKKLVSGMLTSKFNFQLPKNLKQQDGSKNTSFLLNAKPVLNGFLSSCVLLKFKRSSLRCKMHQEKKVRDFI